MYSPLNPSIEEIRLLQVHSAVGDDEQVCCDIITVALKGEHPRYTALSYVWGDATITEEITINSQPRQVTVSLALALRQFRRAFVRNDDTSRGHDIVPNPRQANGHSRRIARLDADESWTPMLALLWADAVCINQEDVRERGQQVSLMGSIYRQASMVMSWLGPAIDVPDITSIDLGLQLLRACASRVENFRSKNGAEFPDSNVVMTSEELDFLGESRAFHEQDSPRYARNKAWNAIDQLSRNPYWTRVWVVQEVVLAKKPESSIMFWGTHSTTLRELLDFNRFVDRFLEQKPPKPAYFDQRVWDWIVKDKKLHLYFVNLVRELRLAELQGGYNYVQAVSLQCRSTDPRDAVFGVCGMLGNEITPSYEKTTAEVYRQYVSVVLGGTSLKGLFDVAGLLRAGRDNSEFSSWMPRLHTLEGDIDRFISPHLSIYPFLALNGVCPGLPAIIDDRNMHFAGVRLDRCSHIFRHPGTDEAEYPETIQKFRALCFEIIDKFGGEYPRNGRRCLEDLLFAASSGLDTRGNPLKITNSIECIPANAFRILMEMGRGGGVDDTSVEWLAQKLALDNAFLGPDAPNLADIASSVSQAAYEEGFHAMNALVSTIFLWSSCPLFRTRKGHMGRAPAAIAEGDLVCLLQGFSGPCLLREQMDHYVLVGACYVNDYSNREPVDAIKRGDLELESFFIK